MERNGNRLKVADVKAMDMVSFLSSTGIEPVKIRGNDYWYLSPLRTERTASFKVNRKLNRWYDHGLGKGGNLVDFGVLYFGCTVRELLLKITPGFSFQPHSYPDDNRNILDNRITVLNSFFITSYDLVQYLSARKIPEHIAERFCSQVRFRINDKVYYAIGFKNDSGGYELRNALLKLSSSPKGVTTIKNGSYILCVFEGFFDFLTYVSLHEKSFLQCDYLVLNSLAFFEKHFAFMEQYSVVRLFLDRDTTGQNCSHMAMERSPVYTDESGLYDGFEDMNDWLIHRQVDSS
ncbi:MAG: toprim domain-containing protein [Chitinophagaceae bacterium]|nr:toprim domain-containing protein [Chitinophagaceae bacterium]